MRYRIAAALGLALVAVFLMGHDTRNRFAFDSIVFSDGTFIHHNQCAEAILSGSNTTPVLTTGATSLVYTPVNFTHLAFTELTINQNSEFSLGTTDIAEMCFDPADDVNGRFVCSFQSDAKITGPPAFFGVQMGYSSSGAIGNGDQVKLTNWVTPVGANTPTQISQTADVAMVDGGCVGLLVAQFGTSRNLSTYSYSLHCRQVSTVGLPCHP